MKKILSPIIFTICLLFPLYAHAEFTDVDLKNPYYTGINYLKENGIVEGYADGTFRPDQKVTRAEALKIILVGSSIMTPSEMILDNFTATPDNNFPDVNNEDWFIPVIEKALDLEIVGGYPDGYFHPEKTINLAECLKILSEANNVALPNPEYDPFKDVPADSWFAKYVQFGKDEMILFGDLYKKIYPEQDITRGHLADLIYRFTAEDAKIVNTGKASYYADMFHGRNTASGEPFDMYKLTAAHRTLPFGTIIRVTNLNNQKTIDVIINDRGPYIADKILDLSRRAFEQIGETSSGWLPISFEILSLP